MTAAALTPEAEQGRFDLHAGALRLSLRADLGGCIAGLWHGDVPVLSSVEPGSLAQADDAACFAQLPYANRLGHHHFRFKGHDYTTGPQIEGEPHSMHGVGWLHAWTIQSHTAQDAVLRLSHAPDADWPFAFEVLQHINLTPSALGVQLVFTNTDAQVQPVGLGWWANFPKRARSRLHIELGQRWESDVTHLPIRKVAQPGLDGDVSHLDFDHAFEGWTGPARIRDERFSLQLRSSSQHLVLRSRPDEDHFSIAPCSHVPNAIHMAEPAAHGLRSLAPGETMEMSMSLDVAVL